MSTALFHRYEAAMRAFDGDPAAPALHLASAGRLSVYYAPFDAVNGQARIVIVGITPGRTQAANALHEARRQLARGAAPADALMRAKRFGALSGALRTNLTAMLDRIGLARRLGLPGCEALFGASSELLQTASVLPFPVFLDGRNYRGTPDIVATPLLRGLLVEHFVPLVETLPEAVMIPLGPVPARAIRWLAGKGLVRPERLLEGLPHPSGANAERIGYFLGRKDASRLSAATNAAKLDAARRSLMQAVSALPAG